MCTPSLASPPGDSRASIHSDLYRAPARVYIIALRLGEASSHIFPQFCSPETVREVIQVGAEPASMELQVVTLEWLGTADKLAVHLAQVSQLERVQRQVVRGPSGLAGRWPGGQVRA